MTAKRRRNNAQPRIGTNHGGVKNVERALGLIIGLGGILLAIFVGFDQVQSHRGALASGLIFGPVLAAIALLLIAALAKTLASKVRRLFIVFGFAFVIAGSVILVLPFPRSAEGATASPSTGTSSPPANADELLWELTVPDETNTCTHAGLILPPGNDATSPTPGEFAMIPGTQLSLLLQSAQTTKIVVTHIETIVDRPLARFSGRFVDITPNCQGTVDERFYLANLSKDGGDVTPRAAGSARAELPPLTVSSEDPVIIYIEIPPVTNAVAWHVQVTWVVNGQEKTSDIYNSGKELIASQQA